MGGIFSESEEEELEEILGVAQDTYEQEISIFRRGEEVVIEQKETHDFLFGGNPQNTVVERENEEITIRAVIQHGRKATFNEISGKGEDSLRFLLNEGECRIKVRKDDLGVLDGVKRFIIHGMPFQLEGTPRPHGLFTDSFYTYHLKRVE